MRLKKITPIIPGILDRNSIPEKPVYNRNEEVEDDYTHDAYWAYANYANAWHMSPAYTRVLQLFVDFGKVAVGEHGSIPQLPVEGFLQAAFDVDPRRFFGRKDDLFIGINSINIF